MSFSNDEYGKRTFEFLDRIRTALTIEDVETVLLTELSWYGLTYSTLWDIPGPGETIDDTISINTRPAAYIEHYLAAQLIDKDPVVTELRRTLTPFSWKDVRDNRRLSKAESRIIDEAREFDSDDGLIVPIVSGNGMLAVFSPCGKNPDLTPAARSALEIIGMYTYHALQRVAAQTQRQRDGQVAPLTAREREIMRWVAVGKTDDEIGTILTIGSETVKTHVENAKIKLNATKRTFAVVQALRFGEIYL